MVVYSARAKTEHRISKALKPAHSTNKASRDHNRKLPQEITVNFLDHPTPRPTHCLAIHAARNGNAKVFVYNVQANILARHCTKLPALPFSPSSGSKTLPLTPLCLPSPESFGLLLSYIYTNDLVAFRRVWVTKDVSTRKALALLAFELLQNCIVLGFQDREVLKILGDAIRMRIV
ncbi:hypothetical protein DL96DRAFT_1702795 [Flagelloscypha sp. PMI_526]|nr:hypothetical protein DL96DRAFT_1702795 [Flagelloscypha sp. PMI_526]